LTIEASPLVIDQGGDFTVVFNGQFHAPELTLLGNAQGAQVKSDQGSLRLVAYGSPGAGYPVTSVNAGQPIYPYSGLQCLFNIGGDPAFANGFQPFSGFSGDFIALEVQPLIDMQSGATGAFTALGVYPYLQSVQGTSNLLAAFGTSSAQGTTATLTNELTIDLAGDIWTNGTVTVSGATPTTASGQVGFGATTAASATAGSATLPAAPVGFLEVSIGGTTYKVAYYNA
jgi:hypothetical protein